MDARLYPSLETLLALALTPNAGAVAVNTLASLSYEAGRQLKPLLGQNIESVLSRVPVPNTALARVLSECTAARQQSAREHIHRAREMGVQLIPFYAEAYPRRLHTSLGRQAPPVLFVLGDPSLLHRRAAGVVGRRQPAEERVRLAEETVAQLVSLEAVIVSGGAQGIDTVAHETALRVLGNTVLVLPQGLGTYTLPEQYKRAVSAGHMTIISSFMLEDPWQTHAAVTRNALIAALSDLVCVVSPRKTGGSVRTAQLARLQNKPVLVAMEADAPPVLQQSPNISPLCDAAGTLDVDGLAQAWASQPQPIPVQAELFPPDKGG